MSCSELMLAVNWAQRGTQEALDILEYANADTQTAWTDQRAANGRETPFGVKMWCLGNEMDGWWQVGHKNAEDYGKLASQTAKAMRMIDPAIELVVCGSSGRDMPTFGSCGAHCSSTRSTTSSSSRHSYYQEHGGNAQEFLAPGVDMARFIESVVVIFDTVAATKKSDKRIMISFDEWNVWYLHNDDGTESGHEFKGGAWPVAPRLLEDKYHALDAVVFGDLMITLLQHADRVRSASLAQLVNVIAPIMTEPGGPAWRQTTFFPFSITSRLGRGRAVRVPVSSAAFTSEKHGEVAALNAVATIDDEGVSLFVVNRSTTDAATLRVDLAPAGGARPRRRRRRVAPPARRRPVRGQHARRPRAGRCARGRGIRRRGCPVGRAARGVVGGDPARLSRRPPA